MISMSQPEPRTNMLLFTLTQAYGIRTYYLLFYKIALIFNPYFLWYLKLLKNIPDYTHLAGLIVFIIAKRI